MSLTVLTLSLLTSLSIATGCGSSVKKADIPVTANPHEEVQKLETDLNAAVSKNVDVLASSEFHQANSYLEKAKKALENGKDQTVTLDDLRSGRGYLQEAYARAENRQGKAEGLFASRQMALTAGAASHPELHNDLDKLDSEVADKATDLSSVDAAKLAGYQARYVDIERRSVVINQLGKSQAMVNGGKKNHADKKAPVSLKNAELSLKNAESMISTNVRNPSGYQAAVQKASVDALQLLNVMTMIDQNGKNLPEDTAIKMVAQNQKISGLTSALGTSAAQSDNAQAQLQDKTQELNAAQSKVDLQKALEKARAEFSPTEAEAYQQGDNLVIRLKQINFSSGRADLPASSLALLAKVSEVAKSLRASQIKVEGHTDSVGTAEKNKAISESRASAVATYFKSNGFNDTKIESEGYGFKKPIATNKSKAGRAQNRRVDVIITPEASTPGTTPAPVPEETTVQ